MAKSGNFLISQAILFMRMSSGPNISAGRRIVKEIPDSIIIFSTWALPRKYGNGESRDGLVMLMWTIFFIPAFLDAEISLWEFSIARS